VSISGFVPAPVVSLAIHREIPSKNLVNSVCVRVCYFFFAKNLIRNLSSHVKRLTDPSQWRSQLPASLGHRPGSHATRSLGPQAQYMENMHRDHCFSRLRHRGAAERDWKSGAESRTHDTEELEARSGGAITPWRGRRSCADLSPNRIPGHPQHSFISLNRSSFLVPNPKQIPLATQPELRRLAVRRWTVVVVEIRRCRCACVGDNQRSGDCC
jgi:hypothetical protein